MFWMNNLDHYGKCVKYISEVCTLGCEPQWTTKNTIKIESKNVILREFSSKKEGEPILIIPPQAGHHSNIADYDTEQSLVESALRHGRGPVYAAEWKTATPDRGCETIDSFIISMRECIQAIGSRVNLVGLCQGGWQSVIYTALYPEDVHHLVLAGAPIDFHAGKSKISMYAALYPMALFQSLVAMGNGILDGKYMLTGFKMLNPTERFYGEYCDLYKNLHDEPYLERSRKFRNWYEYTQNIPGAFYLQVVKELFKENKLIKDRVKILGKNVDLSNIDHPLILIAGDRDDITPQEQLFNIEHFVSSQSITKLTVPAGHIGLFMGKKILRDYWPGILEALH